MGKNNNSRRFWALLLLAAVVVVGVMWLIIGNSKTEFTLADSGINNNNQQPCYDETVLVKNIPKNRIELSKMMISYYDSVGLSIKDFSEMYRINSYHMRFFKSTFMTIRYFVKKKPMSQRLYTYTEEKTYLGTINIWRCKPDSTKYRLVILRNLETATDYEYNGPDVASTTLFSECRSHIKYNYNDDEKSEELVKYYKELTNKKKKPNKER